MKVNRYSLGRTTIIGGALLFLVSCGGENVSTNIPQDSASTQSNVSQSDVMVDERIRMQVASAVESASDLPPGFQVEVNEGVVIISGSVLCDDCGGMRTPGHIGTIQQSLGGVVRAIPGVMRVDFDLSYGPDYPANSL